MIRIAWGHYSIGDKGGVNTVIKRNVCHLLDLFDDYEVTLFGKMSHDIDSFLDFSNPRLSYIDMPCLSVDGKFIDRSIDGQDYHDYRWMGAQIEKKFIKQIDDFDLIFFENSSVGNNPSVNVAFALHTQGSRSYTPDKRFIFRTHDFFFDRPSNFRNVKKLRIHRNDLVPDWHPVIFPNYRNTHYVSINTNDAMKLYENGISRENIHYLPNSVKAGQREEENKGSELRKLFEAKGLVGKDEKVILYPIRVAPRKNVEEAILITQLFNRLADPDAGVREKFRTEGKYRLVISLDRRTGKFKPYADHIRSFIQKSGIPVTLGVGDYVSLERRYHADGTIASYSVSDLYSMSDIVITTSILEGFGMVFIEPWLFDKPLIGRNLFVTKDFRNAGMKLGHLYDSLRVGGTDYPRYGMEEEQILYIASNEYRPEELDRRLSCISDLENRNSLKEFTEDNYLLINNTLSMLRASHNYLAHNKETVKREYSNESVARKLDSIIRSVGGKA